MPLKTLESGIVHSKMDNIDIFHSRGILSIIDHSIAGKSEWTIFWPLQPPSLPENSVDNIVLVRSLSLSLSLSLSHDPINFLFSLFLLSVCLCVSLSLSFVPSIYVSTYLFTHISIICLYFLSISIYQPTYILYNIHMYIWPY